MARDTVWEYISWAMLSSELRLVYLGVVYLGDKVAPPVLTHANAEQRSCTMPSPPMSGGGRHGDGHGRRAGERGETSM